MSETQLNVFRNIRMGELFGTKQIKPFYCGLRGGTSDYALQIQVQITYWHYKCQNLILRERFSIERTLTRIGRIHISM